MTKKKIALIELNEQLWKPGVFLRHSSVEPLGIEYIGAIAREEGWEVKIIQQRDKSDEEILRMIIDFSPEIVGFSVLTYNYPASVSLAKKIKKQISKTLIVFGGYHPSACPEIVKEDAIDFVIIGEGEESFREFINNFDSLSSNLNNIEGLAYYDGSLYINKPRQRIENLDSLPLPLREFNILKDCKIQGLNFPPPSKQKFVAQILYSRGCPYNCTFCCSPFLFGRKVYFRHPENVVNEMQELIENFGTNYFYFADLTFNVNKQKVITLCREIKKRKLDINWFCMCRVDNIDEELLKNMKEAGCSRIGFGIDSLLEKTLRKIKPLQNISLDLIRNTLEICDSIGIITRAFIIIGYPWENREDISEAEEILRRLPIDELRIGLLTPLPGSIIYNEFKKKGLIITNDLFRYTTDEYIIKNTYLSSKEILEIRQNIFRRFYSSENYHRRIAQKIKKFSYFIDSYQEFFDFLSSQDI